MGFNICTEEMFWYAGLVDYEFKVSWFWWTSRLSATVGCSSSNSSWSARLNKLDREKAHKLTKYNFVKFMIRQVQTLNFNSYINRSNKAQKHEKKKQWHELNLTGSQTEPFCNVVFVALWERQSVRDDQQIRHKWRLSCLNAGKPKVIMCSRFPSGRA